MGGTFLAVRQLEATVKWYEEKLGYSFHYFEATGAAGYIGPTLEYVQGLTIRYAGINGKSLHSSWSRMCLVETPEFYPMVHIPYSIQSSNSIEDYAALKDNGVRVSNYEENEQSHFFHFWDLDGNRVRIVQDRLKRL